MFCHDNRPIPGPVIAGRVGIELWEEVLDHAPRDLSSGQRLVLGVIAQNANDITRRGWPGRDVLTRRTGKEMRTIRADIEVLVGRGLLKRIPIGIDSVGRPVYARRGREAEFLLPKLSTTHELGGGAAPPNGAELGGGTQQLGGATQQLGGGTPPPSPQFSSGLLRSAREPDDLAPVIDAVEKRTGKRINLDHASLVVEQITGGRKIRRRTAYVVAAIERDPHPERFAPTPTPPRFRRPTTNGDHQP